MRLSQLIAGVVDVARKQCSKMSWHRPETAIVSIDMQSPGFNSRVLVDGEPIPHLSGFVIYDDGQDVGPRCVIEVITTPKQLDAEADGADTSVAAVPAQQIERIEGVLLTNARVVEFHEWCKERDRAEREKLGDRMDQARRDGRAV